MFCVRKAAYALFALPLAARDGDIMRCEGHLSAAGNDGGSGTGTTPSLRRRRSLAIPPAEIEDAGFRDCISKFEIMVLDCAPVAAANIAGDRPIVAAVCWAVNIEGGTIMGIGGTDPMKGDAPILPVGFIFIFIFMFVFLLMFMFMFMRVVMLFMFMFGFMLFMFMFMLVFMLFMFMCMLVFMLFMFMFMLVFMLFMFMFIFMAARIPRRLFRFCVSTAEVYDGGIVTLGCPAADMEEETPVVVCTAGGDINVGAIAVVAARRDDGAIRAEGSIADMERTNDEAGFGAAAAE
jgi:hypothetical protein